ncbi:hypothetical protein [Marinoscillum sp.]|uniref:hypothetical protein n=1 Tax=Marinoscillum sp. TaxID=2024838 RepID=UPI003BAC1B40
MEQLGFEQIFVNEYATGYIHTDKKTIACAINKDYVPITRFKEIFEMLADEIKSGDYSKFVFDKSKLRTFHQPSMKWYFTEWKTEMIHHGVTKHFKVLPELDYFKRAVEAARKPLLAKYPKELLAQLRIEYFESVEEAVKAE